MPIINIKRAISSPGVRKLKHWAGRPFPSGSHLKSLRAGVVLPTLFLSMTGCVEYSPPPKHTTQLERIRQAGELKVLTRYGPSTYYEGPDAYAGLEYDLVRLFAQRLGVQARFIVPGTVREVLSMLTDHKADLAAAALVVTRDRKQHVRFGPSYRMVSEQLIYNAAAPPPQSLDDLSTGILEVSAGSSHVGTLVRLARKHPSLTWKVNKEQDSLQLLDLVRDGLIDYTVVSSDQALLMRPQYPNLRIGMDLDKRRPLGWALAKSDDDSLYREVVDFFAEIRADNRLAQLTDRYFGPAQSLDHAHACELRRDYEDRLPRYRHFFLKAAEKHGLDWRLLAAVAYQESRWNNHAVSKTGVRGLMMLTQDTAAELHVADRLDPSQSIMGGAQYLQQKIELVPKEIPNPDRVWMGLAAYNVGQGHLDDARKISTRIGGDPNKWIDVRNALSLLSHRNWSRRTDHGYARGYESVDFVNRVRHYYDLLVWLSEEHNGNEHHTASTDNWSLPTFQRLW